MFQLSAPILHQHLLVFVEVDLPIDYLFDTVVRLKQVDWFFLFLFVLTKEVPKISGKLIYHSVRMGAKKK